MYMFEIFHNLCNCQGCAQRLLKLCLPSGLQEHVWIVENLHEMTPAVQQMARQLAACLPYLTTSVSLDGLPFAMRSVLLPIYKLDGLWICSIML